MTKRMIIPLIFGLLGAAVLIWLGLWQMHRLEWKEGVLAEIDLRIAGDPVPLARAIEPAFVNYQAVMEPGRIETGEIHVLVSRKNIGAGYRIIAPFRSISGQRYLIDRGFVRSQDKARPRTDNLFETFELNGNILDPDDRNSSTPPNDVAGNIWFARDVAEMADILGTQPVLIVARNDTGDGVEPLPIDGAGIPNDHLEYAITWFSLATVWLGMTVLLLWRIKRRTD